MKYNPKKWLVAAIVLIMVGGAVFTLAMARVGFDLTKLNGTLFVTESYPIEEAFESISLQTETATVRFVPVADSSCRVECFDRMDAMPYVAVQDGTLTIDRVRNRVWQNYLGFSFQSPKITVYLPEGVYKTLTVDMTTGDIEIPACYSFKTLCVTGTTCDVLSHASVSQSMELQVTTGSLQVYSCSADTVSLRATTGAVRLSSVHCGELNVETSTGRIRLEDVTARKSIRLENTTGGVVLDACDAPYIQIKTTTGQVKGSLLSAKDFHANSSTGKIHIPKSNGSDLCHITTATGNISVSIH